MATKTRAKASAGAGKSKAGRRVPVKAKRGSGVPLMPLVVGGIVGVLAIAMIALIVYYQRPQAGPPAVAGVPCDQLEHSQIHYHAALQIVYNGQVVNLPDNVGIQYDSIGTAVQCYYWLHVHAANKNTIHIESPASDTFTLGQFFDVWNQWSVANGKGPQRLDATHVSTFTIKPEQKVVTYVDLGDGKGAQVYTGDPRAIQLKSHEVITIEITPPDVNPPPKFKFDSGL
ncbi:MAG TPA: hypothetical protein VJP81_04140 [Candidatus Dormibacteraeota bacterium]|nr:hypothetical protein [Candidatus Dormibacteraeota bacterium]